MNITTGNKMAAVILAAGLGKRMKSDIPKVMHHLSGRPLIDWVVDTAGQCGVDPVIAVVGYKREMVMEHLGDRVRFAAQEQQLGTGHAVEQAREALEDFEGAVLILSGDVPLLKVSTIDRLRRMHIQGNYTCTLISCIFKDPSGYGRIVRNSEGAVIKIVEHKDANPEELEIREINSGIYLVEKEILFNSLKEITNDNTQGEYYLTDIVGILLQKRFKVGAMIVEDPLEISGVNSVEQLQDVETEFKIKEQR
ncbi:NTP transferase domain-containing protein [bacterium]|nr:NTP transferase domain-containing protein [bacterium]